MFRTIADFTSSWNAESGNTARLLRTLTDSSLHARMDDQGRTLGRIAWHLVETLGEMLPAAGLKFDFHADPSDVPSRASDIADAYERGARLLLEAVSAQWSDASLLETTNMYGQDWMRGFTLQCLILHQAHHRGQLTVIMRQAGLQVPGMVGPSREEWASMGMPAQD